MDRPKTWSELIELLFTGSWNPDLQRFRSPFAFRGLASTHHHLSNSLLRLAGRASINTVEQSLLRNFSKYAHAQPAPGVESVWHWLALGQHHGLPTRLIDWTYSPFVALHFATEHPEEYEQDGVVWCVNFVEANTLLPKRLKTILQEEQSQTFTIDVTSPFNGSGVKKDPADPPVSLRWHTEHADTTAPRYTRAPPGARVRAPAAHGAQRSTQPPGRARSRAAATISPRRCSERSVTLSDPARTPSCPPIASPLSGAPASASTSSTRACRTVKRSALWSPRAPTPAKGGSSELAMQRHISGAGHIGREPQARPPNYAAPRRS